MTRRTLAVITLLAMATACGDGRSDVTAPLGVSSVLRPDPENSDHQVRTVLDLLGDPFVRELIEGAGAGAESLRLRVRDASSYGAAERHHGLSEVLVAASSALVIAGENDKNNPDEAILAATLALVLDDASQILEVPTRKTANHTGVPEEWSIVQ